MALCIMRRLPDILGPGRAFNCEAAGDLVTFGDRPSRP